MTSSRAVLLGVVTFVVFMALCVALFAVLDVELIFLVGPAIAIGVSSYGVYRGASGDRTQHSS